MRAVNLIPQDQRGGATRGAGRSQGGAYAVLGVVAGLALLALVYGVAAHQVSSRKAKLVSVEAQVQRAQANAAQLAPYTSFQTLREQRINAVNQLVNSRFDWAHAFHGCWCGHGEQPNGPEQLERRPNCRRRLERRWYGRIGHPPWQRPQLHPHRLRDQPVLRCAHARAPTADGRSQHRLAAELDQDRGHWRVGQRRRRVSSKLSGVQRTDHV
jgi:hypothetical protein